jgi:hypothetical protein
MTLDLDLFWSEISANVSKTGTLSYNEIKKLDIYEFFLLLTNLEKQNKSDGS